MSLRRYAFAHAFSGFFEFPTESARVLLPRPLEPVELHHGSSILSASVFDFVESEVGPYRELVLSVVVAPLLRPGQRLPRAALFPHVLASDSAAAREDGASALHLPYWMDDVRIEILREDDRISSRVSAGGRPVAELSVAQHSWEPVSHPYQSFVRVGEELYVADILMEGAESEHEDEAGSLRLHEHALLGAIDRADLSDVPFREVWMRDGVQALEDLSRLPTS